MSLQIEPIIFNLPDPPKDEKDVVRWAKEFYRDTVPFVVDLNKMNQKLLRLRAPNMSEADRDVLFKVQAGEVIFNLTTSKLNFWNGAAWEVVTSV